MALRRRKGPPQLAFDEDDEQLLRDLRDTVAHAAHVDARVTPKKHQRVGRRPNTAKVHRQGDKPPRPGTGRGTGSSTAMAADVFVGDAGPLGRPATAPVGATTPKPPPTNASLARNKGLRRISFVPLAKPERCSSIYPHGETPLNGRFTPTGGFYTSDKIEHEFYVRKSVAAISAENTSGGEEGKEGSGGEEAVVTGGRRRSGAPMPPPKGASRDTKRKHREAEGIRELEYITQTTMKSTANFRSGNFQSALASTDKRGEDSDSDDSDSKPKPTDKGNFENDEAMAERQHRRAMGLGDNGFDDGVDLNDPDCRVTLWVPIPASENPMSYRHLLRSYQNNKLPEHTKLVVIMNKLWYNNDGRDVTMVFPWAKVKKSKAFETTMYSICRTSVILENSVRKGKWILCPGRPDIQRYFYEYCRGRLSAEDLSMAPMAAVFTAHRSTFENPREQQEENAIKDLLNVSSQETLKVGSRPQSAASGSGSGNRSNSGAALGFSPFDTPQEGDAVLPPPINARHAALREEESESDSCSDDSLDPRTGKKRINLTKRKKRDPGGFFKLVSKAYQARESASDWAEESQVKTL